MNAFILDWLTASCSEIARATLSAVSSSARQHRRRHPRWHRRLRRRRSAPLSEPAELYHSQLYITLKSGQTTETTN